MSTTDAAVVLTTLGSQDDAAAFVRALLERRLIACGTILPAARSLYRWEGRTADESEAFVILKTSAARVPDLEAAFTELHPYKVFELLALPVANGASRYLAWIGAETAPAAQP